MKNLISFIGTILIIAFQAAALSAVCWGVKWLFSLMSICDAPGWKEFVGGGIVLFVLLLIRSAYITIKTVRRLKKRHNSIEWKEVDTEPEFEVGDVYKIYVKEEGKWHTVKVASPSDVDNGFTEVYIDEGIAPEIFPKTIIWNCWMDGVRKKNNLL